jgi:hypothetical protein
MATAMGAQTTPTSDTAGRPTRARGKRRPGQRAGSGWRAEFLRVLGLVGNIVAAATAAGVGRATAYRHRIADPDFAARWDEAIEDARDRLEAEAWRRAVHGTAHRKPIYYQGKLVGEEVWTEYSDTLLLALLRAAKPWKYAERHVTQHDIKKAAAKFAAEMGLDAADVDEIVSIAHRLVAPGDET